MVYFAQMPTAQGTFDITGTPNPAPQGTDELRAIRMTFKKTFHGDMEGTSVVEMLGVMDKDLGSGGYVAIERFTGSLHGHSGSFVLQHSSTMDRGRPEQRIHVVPDSGTDALKGLTGTFVINIVEKQHHWVFDFELPA